MSTRRDFVKMVAGASLAPSILRASQAFQAPAETAGLAARVYLEPFDYQGVRLLDGMLKTQYDRTREYYFKIPNDDILKGFRQRAGLPAPGQDMGGWAIVDTSGVFGQWLSGMARMYRATGDTEMKEKATALMTGWAEAFRKDGIPSNSRRPGFNPDRMHYAFDKTLCGMVDMGKYAGSKDALALAETLVDWGSTTLLRTRHPGSPAEPESFPSGNEWYTLSENLYRAYVLTGDPKYKNFGDVWHYDAYWDKFVNEADPDIHGLHAYSHVNTLSSAAMTYGVTGDAEVFEDDCQRPRLLPASAVLRDGRLRSRRELDVQRWVARSNRLKTSGTRSRHRVEHGPSSNSASICCNSLARQGSGIGWKGRSITASQRHCRWRDAAARSTILTTCLAETRRLTIPPLGRAARAHTFRIRSTITTLFTSRVTGPCT